MIDGNFHLSLTLSAHFLFSKFLETALKRGERPGFAFGCISPKQAGCIQCLRYILFVTLDNIFL